MTAVQFSGSSANADRRRRRMATEIDPAIDTPEQPEESVDHHASRSTAAFPMLSRDRLIRRVISPRLWKHITVAVVLTLTPIFYAIATWATASGTTPSDHANFLSRMHGLRGLSGLKLFAAAQCCLLIAWVRSASPVDFRGRFRWWRWLAMVLFAVSVVLLTDTGEWLTSLLAHGLEPIFGQIKAARPALIFVPACACGALILRQVIPDMGRCRASQSLIVISIVLLAVRVVGGARQDADDAVFHLATLELLISGLVLSACQLHARFVIHVNPNPPIAAERKPAVCLVTAENGPTLARSNTAIKPSNQTSLPAAGLASAAEVAETAREPHVAASVEFAPDDSELNVSAASASLEKMSGQMDPPSVPNVNRVSENSGQRIQQSPVEMESERSPHPKGKAGKKQKYRKAG